MVPLFAGAILPPVGGLSEARHQRTETLIPSQRVPLQRAGHVQDSGTQQDVSLQEALGWLCCLQSCSVQVLLPKPQISPSPSDRIYHLRAQTKGNMQRVLDVPWSHFY